MVPSWRSSHSCVPGLFSFGHRASSAPHPPRASGVTGRIDCTESLAPVGSGHRRGPPHPLLHCAGVRAAPGRAADLLLIHPPQGQSLCYGKVPSAMCALPREQSREYLWDRDAPVQLSSLLLLHTPCTRDQDSHLLEPLWPLPFVSPWACPVHVMCIPQAPEMDEAQMTGPGILEVWALVS